MYKMGVGTKYNDKGEKEKSPCVIFESSDGYNSIIVPKIKGLKFNFEFSEDDSELGYDAVFSVIKELNKKRAGFKMEIIEQLCNTKVSIKTVEI